jgi:hypothetical protein
VEAGGERALDVAENALDQGEVRLTQGMHEEAHLLNSSLQVRPSQGEVLESTHNTLVVRAIKRREECAVRGRELSMSVNKTRCRVTLSHTDPLEKICSILSLRQKQTICGASDDNDEEVVEVAHIRHGELRAEFSHDVLKKSRGRCGEDDVIDVEQQVLHTLLVNKEAGVKGGGGETKLTKKRVETLVPRPRSLLESIQGLLEQADVIRSGSVDETRQLLAVDSLFKVAMKKGILHVQLVERPGMRSGETHHRHSSCPAGGEARHAKR